LRRLVGLEAWRWSRFVRLLARLAPAPHVQHRPEPLRSLPLLACVRSGHLAADALPVAGLLLDLDGRRLRPLRLASLASPLEAPDPRALFLRSPSHRRKRMAALRRRDPPRLPPAGTVGDSTTREDHRGDGPRLVRCPSRVAPARTFSRRS